MANKKKADEAVQPVAEQETPVQEETAPDQVPEQEELINIILPKERSNKDKYKLVMINNNRYEVPYGVPTKVPMCVAAQIQDQQDMYDQIDRGTGCKKVN